jgi:hypothetical protein
MYVENEPVSHDSALRVHDLVGGLADESQDFCTGACERPRIDFLNQLRPKKIRVNFQTIELRTDIKIKKPLKNLSGKSKPNYWIL